MLIQNFEGYTFRSAGLFARERHDWMNFHANDVTCPQKKIISGRKIECFGILQWKDSSFEQLQCNHCKTTFNVVKVQRRKAQPENERSITFE